MTLMTDRDQRLRFVDSLPGFPELDDFTLSAIDDRGVLYSLRADDAPELRLVLTPPGVFFADYAPDVPDAVGAALGSDELDVYVVVTLPTGLADATANLRAPVVVARTTAQAMQVILDDEQLPMHRPLIGAE